MPGVKWGGLIEHNTKKFHIKFVGFVKRMKHHVRRPIMLLFFLIFYYHPLPPILDTRQKRENFFDQIWFEKGFYSLAVSFTISGLSWNNWFPLNKSNKIKIEIEQTNVFLFYTHQYATSDVTFLLRIISVFSLGFTRATVEQPLNENFKIIRIFIVLVLVLL